MKYAQLVLGSAGTGKSTYCQAIQEHCSAAGRTVRVANLDPAAETFKYQVAFDIRELISVDDVMAELQLGPNGGLLYAMEYMCDNMDWFEEELSAFVDDDYLILDCPGQIELYTHVPVFKKITDTLRSSGFEVVVVYCVDATFVTDASKLIAGNLVALSAMVHLELPHVNVLTKCDLVDRSKLEPFLSPSGAALANELAKTMNPRYHTLNVELTKLLDDYDMVSFIPLDITDEDSVDALMLQVDNAIAYGENMEPKEPNDFEDYGGDGDNEYSEGIGGAISSDY